MTGHRRNANGFTLIEVLIALAIIAIALTAIVKATSNDIEDVIRLQDKTIAHWVGMHAIAMAQLGITKSQTGSESINQTTMFDHTWYWQIQIQSTPDPYVNKVIVTVRKNADTPIIESLSGFLEARPVSS